MAAEYQVDTYPIFLEKAYYLIKHKSYFGMIVPSAWIASKFNEKLRKFLVSKVSLKNIVIAPKNAFANATVETLILISNKVETEETEFHVERWDTDEKASYLINQNRISSQNSYFFPVYSNPEAIKIIEKINSSGVLLSKYATAVWGVKIYQKGKGKPKQRGNESKLKTFHSSTKTKETHKPLLGGKEIRRYEVDWKGMYVDYGKWLAEPRTPNWFKGYRILLREVTSKGIIQATIVTGEYVFSNSIDGIKLKDDERSLAFILGIINSKLISFNHLNTSANAFKGAFPKLLIKDLLSIPVPAIDFSNVKDKSRHDKMVKLVDRMLELNKQLAKAKIVHDKTVLKRQIEATDSQIDQLVYDLYGLTKKEIEIVEGISK
ncbi:MAG: Eco57I restriction-modification methylase domain-containing protein [Candidatus Marinimicrobia bacterium]|nr:Eco57I restriction-modification methylase domain-containing protein [Candidatus Neomarinimicrobiota bacterium]